MQSYYQWLHLAHELKQPLRVVMEHTTERELKVWIAWLQENRCRPTTTEYYLMQIAQCVVASGNKNAKSVKLKDFDLSNGFRGREVGSQPKTKEQAVHWQKAKWFGALGIKGPIDGKRN